MTKWLARENISRAYQSSTLSYFLITDEAMTYQKCIYCLKQLKKATRNIYEEEGGFPIKSIPSRGTFICTNDHCHATTMTRVLMSSELIGIKSITSSIGFPLASSWPLARKE
jgi:hypothetical protein